jgi:hypothetical protein
MRGRIRLAVASFLLLVALIGTWAALYWSESLFTESHLVGYSCCVAKEDLPARGTLERIASDFFRTFPGKHLPPLVFVSASVAIFATRMAKTRAKQWLPLLFIILNLLYLVADFLLVGMSWSLSDWLNGPQTLPYKGYYRSGYGIALHVALWLVYFLAISKKRGLRADNRPYAQRSQQ